MMGAEYICAHLMGAQILGRSDMNDILIKLALSMVGLFLVLALCILILQGVS